MKLTQTMSEAELRSLSDQYDSVYLHPVRTRTHARSVVHMSNSHSKDSWYIPNLCVCVSACVCVCM